jgi:hypothetical protein
MLLLSLILAGAALAYLLVPMGQRARYGFPILLVLVFHILFWPATRENYLLDRHGAHTTGVITGKDCETNVEQWVAYRFAVGEATYQGRYPAAGGRSGCEGVSVGGPTPITYLKDEPSVNRPTREVRSMWFVGLLLSVIAVALLVWMKGARMLPPSTK